MYTNEATPEAILILIPSFDISDEIPDLSEIAEAVKQLRNGKAPSPSKTSRAETLKEWLDEATREEDPDPRNWDRLIKLVQLCFMEVVCTIPDSCEQPWSLFLRVVAITGG